jgi:hypothetical protein
LWANCDFHGASSTGIVCFKQADIRAAIRSDLWRLSPQVPKHVRFGYQLANLINMPKRDRSLANYHYLGKLADEKRLHELGPVVYTALCQKMIEAGWV